MEIPLSLPMGPCWELEERRVDSAEFLGLLSATFPEVSHAFFEGTLIAPDVIEIFRRFASSGPYRPQPQTLWSFSISFGGIRHDQVSQFSCKFSGALCEALANAALCHAAPELFEHIFLYAGDQPILEWPDAFANCIWIAASIPEERIREFAVRLGLKYEFVSYGEQES